MGAAWPHKLVFRVKRRLKSIFSCNQKTAIKRKHKTATQHSGRDLERRSKGAGRWRYFVPQAQNNAGTKRTLLRRDKMLQYRYFKFSIGYLEDHPTALLGRGAFAPHECFAAGKTSAQGWLCHPEHFNAEGRSGPKARGVHKKGHDVCRVLFCVIPRQFGYFKISHKQAELHPTGLLAGGASAPYKRFRLKRKPWRRANSFHPSILNQRVEAALGGRNPKRKT